MAANKATVATPCTSYSRQSPHWAPCTTLMGGTLAMRAAGETYLPQFAKETADRYTDRLNEAVLYEAYSYAVRTLAGRPFGQPVTLGEAPAEYFARFAEDVDGAGTDLTTFSSRLLQDLLVYGRCHILVDYPDTTQIAEYLGRSLTRADETKYGVRAYWTRIPADAIIGWDGAQIGVNEVLTRLRIRSTVTEYVDGGYGESSVEQITVWTSEWITAYRQNEKQDWVVYGQPRVNTLGTIPLLTTYAQRDGLLSALPPLERLAWLNIQHWQQSSDQAQIEKMARVPMIFLRGFAQEEIESVQVGAFRLIGTRYDQADARVQGTSGAAVRVGREALGAREQRRAHLAMAPMERRPGNPTATELSIAAGKEISDLEAYTLKLERTITQALAVTAQWDNMTGVPVPEVDISQDFGFTPDTQAELAELREDFRLGVIPAGQYLWERQRRGLYSEDMDVQETLQAAQDEAGSALIPEEG